MAIPGMGVLVLGSLLHRRCLLVALLMALATLLGAASTACGSPSAAPALSTGPPGSSATEPAGSAVDETDGASRVPAAEPDGAEDTAAADETDATPTGDGAAGEGAEGDEPATEEGTDSAVTGAPAVTNPEVTALVTEFGQLYLGYDYRVPHDEQVEPLRPLVTPDLFDELAVPLPPGLAESLVTEQRVVTASLAQLEPIEPGVFQVSFEVTLSSGEPAVTTTEPRVLVVSVGADQLVTDVR